MTTDRIDRDGVILISGANKGIGLAIAAQLRGEGFRLSLGARRTEALEEAHGPEDERLCFHRFDAFEPATAERWVNNTIEQWGQIDALVNNAGSIEFVTIMDDNDEALDRLWEVNAKAPLRMTRLCLPHLEACGHGRIINIASLSGKRVRNALVGYNMTKYALMGLTHTTRHVSWDKGVRATAVAPGFVRTEMSAYSDKISPEEMIQPETLAELVSTLIQLPNNAAVAELLVNCRLEDTL
ncbi:MAG: SDR family NAD(P)-dependent oxidoreductase [Actinomycetota bacterium]